ncbi:MAG TPA: hypothetical protein VKU00_28780 [Chthonomonadaceae bacterium]|nr:hypothetical protein [Chthonomonadaceae bacterium]
MTLTIELTPQEEAWINAQTRQHGLSPAEIVRQLMDERIPGLNGTHTAPSETKPIIELDAKQRAAIAYLDARIKEGENATPEEVRQATEEFEELKRNLNANRAATGERLVFP